jgi:cation transport ATPase
VWIGSPRGAVERGVPRASIESLVAPLEQRGESAVIVQIDGTDRCGVRARRRTAGDERGGRPELRELGLDVLVLSGDRRAAAERLGAALALERVESELSPRRRSASCPRCARPAASWRWSATA